MLIHVPPRKCIYLSESRGHNKLFFTTILQNFSLASPLTPKDIDLTPWKSVVGRVPPTY
jgi:hypothetical protein